MANFALRIFIFTFFPWILALIVKWIDVSLNTKERCFETTLIFLFAIGVAGSGIFNFFAHFFISDVVAKSIGWEPGSPFQLEVAFANLALGILGVIATARRDGFREATVIAATVFSIGATIVHFMDIISTGNLAPGNTIQNIGNIVKPILLIWFLVKLRGEAVAGISKEAESQYDSWRKPLLIISGPLAVIISTGYGLGYAIDQIWLMSLVGVIMAVLLVFLVLARSPLHQLKWTDL